MQASAAVRALSALASDPDTKAGEAARYSALDALREMAAAAAAAAAGGTGARAGAGAGSKVLAARKSRASSVGGRVGATVVAALAAFAREFPGEFERYEKKALSFAMARMAGTVGGKEEGVGDDSDDSDEGENGKGKRKGKGKGKAGKKRGSGGGKKAAAAAAAAAISPSCQTLSAALELGCNCLMAAGRAGAGAGAGPGPGAVNFSGGGGAAEDREEGWLKAVFALLKAEGQPENEGEMGRVERAELRLAGSTCVVRLCVSSPRAQVRGWCAALF